jgi:gamma-glutamyltranspeptidase/glutathione hydrolase
MSRVTQRAVAVAAPNPAAADAALRAAAQGGGAVDAAVAAMLVAMVTEPGIVSLAGGAYLTVWPAGARDAVTVDGYVAMPGTGRPDGAPAPVPREVRTDYGGGVTMTAGHPSVATPGALAGLGLAHRQHGTLPWREVVAPAHEAARDGFLLGSAAGYYLPYVRDSLLSWDPETSASVRRPDGAWLETGDRMAVDGLAGTLELIAGEGARTLYDGALADALVTDMARRGGLVTREDLAAYRPVVRPALGVRTSAWSLRTNPPPAIGGVALAAMLTLCGDRGPGPWGAEDAALLLSAQRRVLQARRDRLDVADDRGAAAESLLAEVGWQQQPRSPSTVHVSVVDGAGTACAVTASSGYGSGATVPGTGLWLNNCLGELELNRGGPLVSGERLRSNMAPTVARHDDGSALAIGSPGADRITTALLQVLVPFVHGAADLQEAIDLPRLHVNHLDDGDPDGEVRVEAEEDVDLAALDVPVRRHHRHSMYFGGVGAALVGPDGRLAAAGDPRRAGAVAVGP